MTTPAPQAWVRGSYRGSWHLPVRGGRGTRCGTHLGYGTVQHATDPTHGTCGRCQRLATTPAPSTTRSTR